MHLIFKSILKIVNDIEKKHNTYVYFLLCSCLFVNIPWTVALLDRPNSVHICSLSGHYRTALRKHLARSTKSFSPEKFIPKNRYKAYAVAMKNIVLNFLNFLLNIWSKMFKLLYLHLSTEPNNSRKCLKLENIL